MLQTVPRLYLLWGAFQLISSKGTVTYNGQPVKGLIVVARSGSTIDQYAVTDEGGYYEMDVSSRSVTVKPLGNAYAFSPGSQSVTFVSSSDVKTVNFSATAKIPFIPSTHGFRFQNGWEIPPDDAESMQFPDRENIPVADRYLQYAVASNPPGKDMGLCGGMATLAFDFYTAGLSTQEIYYRPWPPTDPLEDAVYSAIWYRLIDLYLMKLHDPSKGWAFDHVNGVGGNHQVLVYDYSLVGDILFYCTCMIRTAPCQIMSGLISHLTVTETLWVLKRQAMMPISYTAFLSVSMCLSRKFRQMQL